MNDFEIRNAFHNTFLTNEHHDSSTLVVDELGIKHGRCRADIAVINGHLIGFEIKSDVDSLIRLENQIEYYNTVFDQASIVTTQRHLEEVIKMVPDWWGIILVSHIENLEMEYQIVKEHKTNKFVDDYSVAQLLWKNEVQEILHELGFRGKKLRENRAHLYQYLAEMLDSEELRKMVREYLKMRKKWRVAG
ncbi:MAG: hypothetical protein CL609_23615 [Anaerolineaceae bacterium]|nr:hypothetical protein [Anaerolineaceae bacterium]